MMMDPTATMLHGDEDMLDDLERAKRHANMMSMGGIGGGMAGAGGGMADGIIPGAAGTRFNRRKCWFLKVINTFE